MSTMPRFLRSFFILWSVLPAAPVAGRAASPTLTYLFPAGAQRGKTVVITAGGTFDRWPLQAWSDRKDVEVEAAKDEGKLTVRVSPHAVPGLCWIRLHDALGASNLRPFLIGTVPETLEAEPNDEPTKPQLLAALPVVVNGRLEKAGDVDTFAVRLRKGETLVASLEANRTLASPVDAILQVLSADGFVLEQNHDDHGLDPQLLYTAPKDDLYLVRAFGFPAQPDASIRFAGGSTYVYRLTLTTGGFADHAFPLAVSRADPGPVEVVGWNIPAAAKKLTVKHDILGALTLWHPQLANTLEVLVEPHRCMVERELNDPRKPQSITLPATISGRIDVPGDRDVYEFPAKKGQRLSFHVAARSIDSQLDPVLRLTDSAGKRIAQAEVSMARRGRMGEAELSFTVPQDGAYRLEVRDQTGHGSFRHFYRLRAVFAEPDYVLGVASDRFVVTPGKPLSISVTIERRNGFDRDIEIAVVGLPTGVTAAPVKSTKTGTSATLRLEGQAGARSGAIGIVGRVSGQEDHTRLATAPLAGLRALTPHLWLTTAK